MSDQQPGEITLLLTELRNGNQAAAEDLLALTYRDLRQLAQYYLQYERPDHTLQPTALVHEVYLRLFGHGLVEWRDRQHFFTTVARQMRRTLVDYARSQRALRRGGLQHKLPLEELDERAVLRPPELAALDEALLDLERLSPRTCRVVELRFFGGLTEAETALVLGVSVTTVKRDWEFAKVWLFEQMNGVRLF